MEPQIIVLLNVLIRKQKLIWKRTGKKRKRNFQGAPGKIVAVAFFLCSSDRPWRSPAPPRPARDPEAVPRVDKDQAELLSSRPRFPLCLAHSLLRERRRDAETLTRRRRAIAGVPARHSRIAMTRRCAPSSSTSSPSSASRDAAVSSSSSFSRINTARPHRRFRPPHTASDLADPPVRFVVSVRIILTPFPSR